MASSKRKGGDRGLWKSAWFYFASRPKGEGWRLHLVPGIEWWKDPRLHDRACFFPGVAGKALCGLRSRWNIPGIFSRMGLRRCDGCSEAAGFPHGFGAPVNDKANWDSVEPAWPTAPRRRAARRAGKGVKRG